MEGLASGLETLFSRVREGTLPLDQRATRVIHQVLDASEDCVGAFRDNRVPEEPAAALRAIEDLLGIQAPEDEGPAGLPKKTTPDVAPAPPMASQPAEMVRLPAENLDRLVRSTGQILSESLRQASVSGELDVLDHQIAEMAAECVRFRKASSASLWRLASQPEYSAVIRHVGFVEQKVALAGRPVEERRVCCNSAAPGTRNVRRNNCNGTCGALAWLRRKTCLKAFERWCGDLAREENKEIDFRPSGSGVRADRIVLQALKDPVMHLLRNAISHGIETPRGARQRGKTAGGVADPASGFAKRTPDRGGGRRWPGSRSEESGQGAFRRPSRARTPPKSWREPSFGRVSPRRLPSTICPDGAWDSRWSTKRCTASRET